jgi:D-amino-acid dehydrogenase
MGEHKDILIIGGGVSGLCSAYYLTQAGHQVTVLDQSDMQDGCSYGNAGMIVPSHFVPLASPGMISKGFKWMLRRDSPFYIHPKADLSLLSWGLKFYRASNAPQARKAMESLRDISLLSRSLFEDFGNRQDFRFSFETKGLLMLCKTAPVAKEEAHYASIADKLGIEARVLNHTELCRLEPDLQPDVLSGIYYPGDAHCNPGQFMDCLKSWLVSNHINLVSQCRVTGFKIAGGSIKEVDTSKGPYRTDEVILCAGSWSEKLTHRLQLTIPVQAGKGYGMTVQRGSHNLHHPCILCDARVAITPMGNLLRFGGTMEFGGKAASTDIRRVQGILKSLPQYFPGFYPEVRIPEEVWSGLRPCSPDGLPYIGKTKKYRNLMIATGHAMMGLSLGPATGKLICDLMNNKTPVLNMLPFSPDRYG